MAKTLGKFVAWVTRRPSYALLTADDERLAALPPERFANAWLGLLVQSLGWGVAACGVYILAWRFFDDYNIALMPPLMTMLLWLAWPMRRALPAAARAVAGPDPTVRAMTAAALVVTLLLCLMRLRSNPYLSNSLPVWVRWGRPHDVLYRVLVLMPLWGAWAMMITGQFCKPGPNTSPAVAAFARGCGAMRTAAVMGILMALSILYFAHLPWRQLSISIAAVIAAVIAGLIFCRRTGGLTRDGLLAANFTTQLVFLLAYLAN